MNEPVVTEVKDSKALWRARRWQTILWAASPAIVVVPFVIGLGWNWPHLRWVIFFAAILNMYAWSAVALWSRRIEHWEIRAVPLALVMMLINGAIMMGVDALCTAMGLGASAGSPPP